MFLSSLICPVDRSRRKVVRLSLKIQEPHTELIITIGEHLADLYIIG